MNRIVAACGMIALSSILNPRPGGAAVVVPVPAGPAFHALPLAGWGGVMRNLYPAVNSQALLNPRLLPLQGVLSQVSLRLSENGAAGLGSMEFVRFMPKTYRERPAAFARLAEDRQIASLSRGVRAASRALDGEAAELTEKIQGGQATAAEVERLATILSNNFYLSPGVRRDVEERIAGLTSQSTTAEPTHPALRRIKQILAVPPVNQGAIFDNNNRSPISGMDAAPAVFAGASQPSLRRPSGLAPSRANSKDKGEPMKTVSKKAKAAPKAATRASTRNIRARIIKELGLQPLPGEGGYYRETYRSGTQVPIPSKNGEKSVTRHLGTAIYYFVTPREFSALHRLTSDEVFHFYGGDPVEMLQISETGEAKSIILGPDVLAGHQPQVTVPAGTWQGTRLVKGGKYALLGTTVFPAFEFADFELGKRADLTARFPELAKQIKRFTRK